MVTTSDRVDTGGPHYGTCSRLFRNGTKVRVILWRSHQTFAQKKPSASICPSFLPPACFSFTSLGSRFTKYNLGRIHDNTWYVIFGYRFPILHLVSSRTNTAR